MKHQSFKKITSFALALSLIMIVLSGCSTSKGNSVVSESSSESAALSSSVAPANPEPPDNSSSEAEASSLPETPTQQIAGKYVQPDDPNRWLSENAKPYIILNENGSCQLLVNMLSTMCLADGTYTVEDEAVIVTLTSSTPDGMLNENPQLGVAYNHMFFIIDNNTLAIQASTYATQAGDTFIREQSPLAGLY